MTILSRYILREMLKVLVLVLGGAVGLYLVVDFFENVDHFIEAGLPAVRIVDYFKYKLPLVVAQVMPAGVLLAALATLGLMNRRNEILAVVSSGASARAVFRPVLAAAVVLGAGLFFFSETVVPVFTARANAIWLTEVKKKNTATAHHNIWIKEHRAIHHVAFYHPVKREIVGVAFNFFDDRFRLVRRVDAERGVYADGRWRLTAVMDQRLDPQTGEYRVALSPEIVEAFDLDPEELKGVMKRADEMGALELWDYIQEAQAEGYDASAYRVDFHAKFARPAALFLVLATASVLAVARRARDSLVVLMACGGGVFFLYFVLHSFCVSIGYGGGLPPTVAAWAANALFAAAGLIVHRVAGL
jgi:lipopolysaccharide export system permease protein